VILIETLQLARVTARERRIVLCQTDTKRWRKVSVASQTQLRLESIDKSIEARWGQQAKIISTDTSNDLVFLDDHPRPPPPPAIVLLSTKGCFVLGEISQS